MSLAYDAFVNDPPSQDGLLPNGEPGEDFRSIILASWL